MDLSPKQIVEQLDKYIIGQDEAKKAVAIALRNRYRRSRLPKEVREEITPKNIIMKGPTGVGKTEIARRLAKLVRAPFVKVEATKYTEVGYVGKDVEGMIRDLAECSYRLVKAEKEEEVKANATSAAEKRVLKIILEAKKIVLFTHPVSSGFTEHAFAAGNNLLRTDSVPNFPVSLDLITNFHNSANKLMTRNHRCLNIGRIPITAPEALCTMEGLHITCTDPTGFYLQDHFTLSCSWGIHDLKSVIARCISNNCFHLFW